MNQKLLPSGTIIFLSVLGILYATSALLAVTVTCTEIYLSLFLQELHGRPLLQAGYIAAAMSAGWTAAAVYTSTLQAKHRAAAVRTGPALSFASMAILIICIPWTDVEHGWIPLVAICAALVIGGADVGLAYPHLSTSVLRVAPTDEADNAASSIMTVQRCATAFGAALAGLSVNLAGASTGAGTWTWLTQRAGCS